MANIFKQMWDKAQKEINEAIDNGREFVKDVQDGTFLNNVKDKCEDITNTISGKLNNATDFDRDGKSDFVEGAEWAGNKAKETFEWASKKANNATDFDRDGKSDFVEGAELAGNKVKETFKWASSKANKYTDFDKDGKSDIVEGAEIVSNKLKDLKNYLSDHLDVDNDGKINAVKDFKAFMDNTRETIENGHKQFLDTFDKNNNGLVGVGELTDYFKERLADFKEKMNEAQEMLKIVNEKGGSTVDLNTDPATKEEMQKYFLENADVNKDGKIKTSEIAAFLKQETTFEEGKANEVLDKLDYNRDGKLTINEDLRKMLDDAGVKYNVLEVLSYANSKEGSAALGEIMSNIEKVEKEASSDVKEERLDNNKGNENNKKENDNEKVKEEEETKKDFASLFDKDGNGKADIFDKFNNLFDKDKDGEVSFKEVIDNVADKIKETMDKDKETEAEADLDM